MALTRKMLKAMGIEDEKVEQWIGNTYLDDSGRDSPASPNSTGDMQPDVEWILKLSYRCT